MNNNNNNNYRGGRYPPGIGAGRGAINPNPNFQSRPGYQQQQPPPQYVQRGSGYSQQQQQFQQAPSQQPHRYQQQQQQQWLRRPQISGGDAVAEVEKTVLSEAAIDTKLVAFVFFFCLLLRVWILYLPSYTTVPLNFSVGFIFVCVITFVNLLVVIVKGVFVFYCVFFSLQFRRLEGEAKTTCT